MKLSVACPCGNSVEISESDLGGQVRCPNCKAALAVQSKSHEPSPAIDSDKRARMLAKRKREQFIRHERAIRQIGVLHYANAGLFFVLALLVSQGLGANSTVLLVFLGFVILGVLSSVIGYGFATLRRWIRTPAMALFLPSMFIIPFGLIFGIYAFLLLAGEKGRVVCSSEYADVIALTNEMSESSLGFQAVASVALLLFNILSIAFAFSGVQ